MLLRHTTDQVADRKALTVNPAKTCQPIGAMVAALGIRSCLPHSHGSQGCCAYHRSTLTRHSKEPVVAGTSSFTEGASVFGGQANLIQAIDNIFSVYDPDVIAVHTTCLSETIGDDIVQIVAKAAADGRVPDGRHVIHCNTPSYVGSHVTGFANMVEGIFKALAGSVGSRSRKVNLLPGWVEPADMRELKHLCTAMGVDIVMCPDTSDVLDAPLTGTHAFYPKGGVTLEELKGAGDCRRTLALGPFASRPAAKMLDARFRVPFETLDIPIGLSATDRFVQVLADLSNAPVPKAVEEERGRLVDMIADMHQYLYGRRVALWGDPDHLTPLVEFLMDLDMRPVYVVSGTPGRRFPERLTQLRRDRVPEIKVRGGAGADMFLLHQWLKKEKVDLLMGNTYGKYIARDEGIPLVRHGFPILDRVGHSYFPTVGYMGALRLLEKILDAVLDNKDEISPEESFELVM
jgi:nitrogenase molybdenum-iron protein beta chain